MEVVIGVLLVLLLLFGIGYFIRKNVYREVDRLEARKIEIMNRSLVDEMSKVKNLKMTGQAEELFERWRNEWDEIITTQLPEVEELLFDAEDHADKYRFKKSRQVLEHIENMLDAADQNIEQIIEEIYELVSSEEKNTTEIDDLREQFKKAKKTLLAYSHTFGKAHPALEAELLAIYEGMKEFDAETDSGNYLAAREILMKNSEELTILQMKINQIPSLLSECVTSIPLQLAELLEGYKEMEEQGYFLGHIHAEAEAEKIAVKLEEYKERIEQTDIEGIQEALHDINESIETMYDLLEKEVRAHHYIQTESAKAEAELFELDRQKLQTSEETDLVKQSYHLTEQDFEKQRHITKQLSMLRKRYDHVKMNLTKDQIAYSILKEELTELEKQILIVKKEHEAYREMLLALRKEELQARQQLSELKVMLTEAIRMIQKSNVPGLPEAYKHLLEEANVSVKKVAVKLEEIPLDMVAVNILLEDSADIVKKLSLQTADIVEHVFFIEKIIQYGNRYRSKNSGLAVQLKEAEDLFRNFQYDASLEKAAAAIESIEPGVMKRLENSIEEDLEKIK
ncbi:septation ring formation regulator EzrA [Metabacillus sp. RGM 3146]|uniref:septation ring formation regulator EzrA n=1 Tax=Metabacillus sp. RGM 3146 TaxID=3401092 RepID=UPI003B99FECC